MGVHLNEIIVRDLFEPPFRGFTAHIPLGQVCLLTGKAGSGKSVFARDVLAKESRERFASLRKFALGEEIPFRASCNASSLSGLPPTTYVPCFFLEERSEAPIRGYLSNLSKERVALGTQAASSVPLPEGSKIAVVASVSATQWKDTIESLLARGFERALDGLRLTRLSELLAQSQGKGVLVVIDRFTIGPSTRARLTEALETARSIRGAHTLYFAEQEGSFLPLSNQEEQSVEKTIGDFVSARSEKPLCAPLLDLCKRAKLAETSLEQPLAALSDESWVTLQFVKTLLEIRRARLLVLDRPTGGLSSDTIEAMGSVISTLPAREISVLLIDDEPRLAGFATQVLRLPSGVAVPLPAVIHEEAQRYKPQAGLPHDFKQRGLAALWGTVVELHRSQIDAVGEHCKALLAQAPLETLPRSRPPGRVLRLTAVHPTSGPYSTAATQSGLLELLRDWFTLLPQSKAAGLEAADFSYMPRSRGRSGACDACSGTGREPSSALCHRCAGSRYRKEVTFVRYRGASIDEVLRMSLLQAASHFADVPKIATLLRELLAFELGALPLDRAAARLSSGELARLSLASTLAGIKGHGVLILSDFFAACQRGDRSDLLSILSTRLGATMAALVADS